VRAANGTITDFDPTGSTATEAWGINTAGDIMGYYTDANTAVSRLFADALRFAKTRGWGGAISHQRK
jgi:hypothetical protein